MQNNQQKKNKGSEKRAVAAVERRVDKLKKKVEENRQATKMGGPRGSEADKLNREMHKASKVMMVKTPKTSLHTWLEAASRPFDGRSIPCPVNYAPAPSLISTTATITCNLTNLVVNAGKTTQIGLFPGHCGGPKAIQPITANGSGGYIPLFPSQIDATSFHHQVLTMRRSAGSVELGGWLVGPLDDQAAAANYGYCALGGLAQNLDAGTASFNTQLWDPLTPDVQLPFKCELGSAITTSGGRHVRWRLDSMGIRILNTTPMIDRGAAIQSCQFTNSDGVSAAGTFPTVASNEVNPTFKLHKTDAVEVAWIPRFQDLAYWHVVGPANLVSSQTALSNGNTFQIDDSNLGMAVWLTSSEKAQTFSIQIIQNFSLAGPLVNSIGGPAPHMPEVKDRVEHVVTTAQNFSSTFADAPKFGAKVEAALSEGKEYVAHAAAIGKRAINAIAKAGFL